MQERVDRFPVSHEHGLGLLHVIARAEENLLVGGERGEHPVGKEVGEQHVGVDRPVVADFLGEIAGLFRQLAHALGELAGLGHYLLALLALGLDLLLRIHQVRLQQRLFLLGDLDGHIETLDPLLGLGLLFREGAQLLLLALGLRLLFLQLALDLREAFLGHRSLLRGGGHPLVQLAHALLGGGQR